MGKWCDDGIYMLASQPLDRCQSQEGAESALQELEGYLETASERQEWDMEAVWREYESVLSEELKVRSPHEYRYSTIKLWLNTQSTRPLPY